MFASTSAPARATSSMRRAGGHRPAVRCRAADAAPTVAVTFRPKEGEPLTLEVESGEQLRAAMIANKVDLYTTWGKIWSCGGAGQCGTCIVNVESASDGCLSERSATEALKLKGKPASWRLACQTFVGDGETPGQSVVIATKPQQ
jgi:ferredoxin